MKATYKYTQSGERVLVTERRRNAGHGDQVEVVYSDGSTGWEHLKDLQEGFSKVRLFRVDEYQRNMGSILGFTADYNYAVDLLAAEGLVHVASDADGNFGQITEFEVPDGDYDTEDQSQMMALWSDGEIVKNFYFVEA